MCFANRHFKRNSDLQKMTDSFSFTEDEIPELRSKLLSWYDQNKRDLPWRKTSVVQDSDQHAYEVWVSEIMLQQTRVATVIDYYNRWMKKWPTLASLSEATIEEVNEMWSGLGYYSRGRRLHEGANKVMESSSKLIPTNSKQLLKQLPGVGRYTAAAIASIAFHEPVGVLDGNVTRVLCRLQRIGGNSSSKEVIGHLWKLTNDIVDVKRPGDFNQAIMELGATVCLPKNPKCSRCPLNYLCKAKIEVEGHKGQSSENQNLTKHIKKKNSTKKEPQLETILNKRETNGDEMDKDRKKKEKSPKHELHEIEDFTKFLCLTSPWLPELGVTNYPRKPPKKAPRNDQMAVLVVEATDCGHESNNSKWLIVKRKEKGLLAGLWEFPNSNLVLPLSDNQNISGKLKSLPKTKVEVTVSQNCLKQLSDIILSSYDIVEQRYLGEVVHIFSHIHQTNHVFHVKIKINKKKLQFSAGQIKLVTTQVLKQSAISSSVLKILKLCTESKTIKSPQKRKASQSNIDSFFSSKRKKVLLVKTESP